MYFGTNIVNKNKNQVAYNGIMIFVCFVCFRMDACPLDCSGHGECQSRSLTCHCHAGWHGNGCQIPMCLNHCSNKGECRALHSGTEKYCSCDSGYRGQWYSFDLPAYCKHRLDQTNRLNNRQNQKAELETFKYCFQALTVVFLMLRECGTQYLHGMEPLLAELLTKPQYMAIDCGWHQAMTLGHTISNNL